MNNLQMLKKAMLAYVSAVKFIWSAVAYPLSIVGKKLMNLRGYRVYGNSIQDGTPMLETPIEIQSVGDLVTDEASEYYGKYDVPVTARGRNLLPTPTFSTFTKNGVKFTNNKDGSITINGTPTAFTSIPNMYLPDSTLEILRNNVCVLTGFYNYEKNISFALSIGLNGNWIKYIYLNPYTYKNYVKVDLTNVEFDTVVLTVRSQNVGVLIDNLTVKPLLEVGTTMPTSFEPYIAPVTTNIFLDEPLRKVGDYADYIDYDKQKVVRKVARTDSLRAGNIYNWINRHGITTESVLKYTSTRLKGMSNRLNVFTASGNETCTFWLGVSNRIIYWVGILDVLGIYSDSKTSKEMIEEFNTWLADNPTYVIYPLATPTEEPVTLPVLPQFKGTTIYEVGANIKPSGMEAKYC